MQGFATQAFAGGFNVPAFSEWLDDADHEPSYHHHARVLKTLQWKYPGSRWLLKSPDHLAAVDAIFKVYPDACIVHIHRDPVRSISSWASLNFVYRSVYYRKVDRFELGQQVLTRLSNDTERCLRERSVCPQERFLDVSYSELMQNPIDVIQGIYDHFEFELPQEVKQRMRDYLAANPMNKHGAHKYTPSEFGLDASTIHKRFANYIDTFRIS